MKERFPSIADALTRLGHDAVVDGRLFSSMSKAGHNSSSCRTTAVRQKAFSFYYVFDLLYLDGYDLRTLPFCVAKSCSQASSRTCRT